MRVLIVDDESPAQTSLARVLGASGDVESLDLANNGVEALQKLRQEPYDVLLLHINTHLIGGVELLDQLRQDQCSIPSVIFITAPQKQPVALSERQAVDYVLKLLTTERLREALERAVQESASERELKLLTLLSILRDTVRPRTPKIAIKAKGRILFIDPLQILSVHAEGNYVLLQKESGSYLLRESISDMLEKLRPYGFIRIHRSILVNGSMVEEIHPYAAGACRVRIKGGKEHTVARSYRKNLRYLADSWIGSESFLGD
jgi:two-component system LytT family response regulator